LHISSTHQHIVLSLIERLRAIFVTPWRPVSGLAVVGTSLGLSGFLWLLKTDPDGFVFLDYANLAFHEAGHPIFGIFGSTLGLYGGTLGQLVFPVVALLAFWRQREPIGFTVATVWLSENFLNIARYMADARAQVLPLAGGGEHDWTEIFSRWGVLTVDTSIARIVTTAGWMGMLVAWGWLIWRWKESSHGAST
jgi:hypothetical protein